MSIVEIIESIPFLEEIIGGLIGGLFTYLASRYDARMQFRKWKSELDLQQQHQDEQEFLEMIRLADEQLGSMSIDSRAIAAICLARSKASGDYAAALDDLYFAVASTERSRIPGAIEKVTAVRSKLISHKK